MPRLFPSGLAIALVAALAGAAAAQPYEVFPGRSHGGPEVERLRVKPDLRRGPIERQRLLDAQDFRNRVGGNAARPVKPRIPGPAERRDPAIELRATEGRPVDPTNADALQRQGPTGVGRWPQSGTGR